MDPPTLSEIRVGGGDLGHEGAGRGVLRDDGGVAGLDEAGRGVVGVGELHAEL